MRRLTSRSCMVSRSRLGRARICELALFETAPKFDSARAFGVGSRKPEALGLRDSVVLLLAQLQDVEVSHDRMSAVTVTQCQGTNLNHRPDHPGIVVGRKIRFHIQKCLGRFEELGKIGGMADAAS